MKNFFLSNLQTAQQEDEEEEKRGGVLLVLREFSQRLLASCTVEGIPAAAAGADVTRAPPTTYIRRERAPVPIDVLGSS